jgi:hypothetical protein
MSDFSENPPRPIRGTEETDFPVPAQPRPLDRGSNSRERLITLVAAAIVAALVAVVMVFGLRAFQGNVAYGPGILERNQLLQQQGKVKVFNDKPVEVYYPIPYASPPHLTIQGDVHVNLLEQKPDHFKVQGVDAGGTDVQWSAQGQRAAGK